MELHAIVLAAGSGSRFGGRKLFAPYRDGVLLDASLASALASPAVSVVLVTGADASEVAATARGYADQHANGSKLRIAFAPDYREGMAASLRAGLAALSRSADGFFIFLGDMPQIPVTITEALAAGLSQPGILAVAPACDGRRGHPVLFAASLLPKLASLGGDSGARGLLDDLGAALHLVTTSDRGVLLDIDTRSDLLGRTAGSDQS